MLFVQLLLGEAMNDFVSFIIINLRHSKIAICKAIYYCTLNK